MLDHFGGRERTELGGGPVILTARKSDEKARGEQIARAGRIYQLDDRRGPDHLVAFA